jgi:GNAT-family acetyltransferase (TIGR03103 family)
VSKMNIYARILMDEAKKRGIEVEEIDSRFNLFALKYNGLTVLCRESLTDKTSAYAMTVCANKWLTGSFLRKAGLKFPRQDIWENHDQALVFLSDCGGRVVVKPLNGEQGRGITVDVRTAAQLKTAVEKAGCFDSEILLEEFVEGKDLRLIVINYRFVAAIERVPANITGNNKCTVKELIESRNRELELDANGESKILVEAALDDLLSDQGLSLHSVPPLGKEVRVCRLANYHSGGTIKDVTDQVSPTLRAIAEKAARVLNIPVVGLDFLVPSVSGEDYYIIEANERPGLANHEPQPTAECFIDFLFPETA